MIRWAASLLRMVYVPIDFNEESVDKLFAYGFDTSPKGVFVWEGVTYYLSADAVDGTLAWIRRNAEPWQYCHS